MKTSQPLPEPLPGAQRGFLAFHQSQTGHKGYKHSRDFGGAAVGRASLSPGPTSALQEGLRDPYLTEDNTDAQRGRGTCTEPPSVQGS